MNEYKLIDLTRLKADLLSDTQFNPKVQHSSDSTRRQSYTYSLTAPTPTGTEEYSPALSEEEALDQYLQRYIVAQHHVQQLLSWKQAVIEKLVVWHIYNKSHENDAEKALNDLLEIETSVALDPQVSEAAFELTQPDTELLRAVAELSAALGSPYVHAVKPQTIASETVRRATEVLLGLREVGSIEEWPDDRRPVDIVPSVSKEDLKSLGEGTPVFVKTK